MSAISIPQFASLGSQGQAGAGSGSSLTTASQITPVAGSILVIYTVSTIISGSPSIPTLSDDGPGLTYTNRSSDTYSTQVRVSIFTSSVCPGTAFNITSNWGVNQPAGIGFIIVQATNCDTVNPFVQRKFNTATSTAVTTGTYSPVMLANSGTVAFMAANGTPTFTPKAGYTANYNTPAFANYEESFSGTDTASTGTISSSLLYGMVGVEIRGLPFAGEQLTFLDQGAMLRF